jgi:hypothetical protein
MLVLVEIILFIESDKLGSESHKDRVASDFWYPLKQAQIQLIEQVRCYIFLQPIKIARIETSGVQKVALLLEFCLEMSV